MTNHMTSETPSETTGDPNLRLVVDAVNGVGSQFRVGARIERLLWAYCVANGITDERQLAADVADALGTTDLPPSVSDAIARMVAASDGS